MMALLIFILAAAAIPAVMFLWNLRAYAPPPGVDGASGRERGATPRISLLIPARNEEERIGSALSSCLTQSGVDLEVLVLDDQSTDRTAAIVTEMAARDSRVRLIAGSPLPEGWCGKNWACHLLSFHARHEWLIFLDADVQLEAGAAAGILRFMERSGADLGSGIPRQVTVCSSERLLIPLIHFVLLGFLPMRWMRERTSPGYGAACGQLIAVRTSAYKAVGGHAAIRASLHDGLQLARTFRAAGFRTDLFDATRVALCRMYESNREVWAGLAKNAVEGLGHPARILPMTLLLTLGQVAPFAVLPFAVVHSSSAAALAIGAIGLAWLPRVLAAVRFQQCWSGVLLHPLGVASLLAIQWFSLGRFLAGKPATWKGRSYTANSGVGVRSWQSRPETQPGES